MPKTSFSEAHFNKGDNALSQHGEKYVRELGWRHGGFEDFIRLPGAALPLPWGDGHTVETLGTAIGDFVADIEGGEFELTLDTDSEVHSIALDWVDQLIIPFTPGLVCEWEFRTNPAITTAEVAVIGLAAAHNATLDSIVTNAWFRLTASQVLVTETDDGTNDVSNISSITLAADELFLGRIEVQTLGSVAFFLGTRSAAANPNKISWQHVATHDMSALTDRTLVQPYARVGKSTGATTPSLFANSFGWRYGD